MHVCVYIYIYTYIYTHIYIYYHILSHYKPILYKRGVQGAGGTRPVLEGSIWTKGVGGRHYFQSCPYDGPFQVQSRFVKGGCSGNRVL